MATNKNIDIDTLFREKLSGYELESPQNVWNNIMLQKANKPLWKLSYSIVILLVSALSGISAYYMSAEQSPKLMAQQNIQEQIDQIKDADANEKTMNVQNIKYEENQAKGSSETSEKRVSVEVNKDNFSKQNLTAKTSPEKNVQKTQNPFENTRREQSSDNNKLTETTNATNNSFNNKEVNKTTEKSDLYAAFNQTIERDKSIPSLVLSLDKPQPEKTDEVTGANNTTKTNKDYKPSPWSFETGVRTVFANPTYQNTNQDWSKQVASRKASESFLPSFGLSVKANYNVNKIVSFTSGISYVNLKQKLDFNHTNTEINITEKTRQGYILNPDGTRTPYTQTYMDTTYTSVNTGKQNTNQIKMIDIPLMLDLKFLDLNKFSLSFQPGVMANIYMKKTGYEINQNADNTELSNANNSYKVNAGINYRIGLSAAWSISKNASIVVQPYYIQNANGLNSKKYPVNYKINQFSTDIGIRFQLP